MSFYRIAMYVTCMLQAFIIAQLTQNVAVVTTSVAVAIVSFVAGKMHAADTTTTQEVTK